MGVFNASVATISRLRPVHFVSSSTWQAPGKQAAKTVRQRVSHAICGSTQEAKTTVDRKKTTMVPKIRITVRHVRWDVAVVFGRVDPVFAG